MAAAVVLGCLVLLLVVANGAPIVARRLLHKRLDWPVDGGRRARDGRPLLGKSKTWRGVVAAIVMTAVTAWLLGLSVLFGAAFGAVSMLGDLLSSYLKRRFGLPSSARATGLDQLPEALLPALLSHWWLGVGWWLLSAAVVIFFVLVMWLSPWLYRLGIRRRPH